MFWKPEDAGRSTALIDGDYFIYLAASAVERATDWGGGLWTLHALEGEGQQVLQDTLTDLQERAGAERLVLGLSDTARTFRYDLWPAYKANRAGKRRPMILGCLIRYAEDAYETVRLKGLEGDDTLGVLATAPHAPRSCILVSCDKDIRTVPGRHLALKSDEIVTVSEDEADYLHCIQTLGGDLVDGYAGVPGVGPKTAAKLLQNAWCNGTLDRAEAWGVILKAFEKAGMSAEEALLQARLARILRSGEYNYEDGSVSLWKAPEVG